MGADDLNEEKMDELLKLMRAVVPDISDMSDAGKVGFVYKFDYDPTESYEILDVVKFGMSLWTPKTDTIGNPPPDQSQEGQENVEENEFWMLFLPGALGSDYVRKTDIAKAPTETEPGKLGVFFPDGKTLQINEETGELTGTPVDFVGTLKELQQEIQAGNIEDGMNLFVDDPDNEGGEPDPDHPNNMLFQLDDYLSRISTNAVQNWVIAGALERLEQLENETRALRATLETFGLSKICPVDVTDVTEANGMVLGAFEKNASIEGTLGNKIEKVENNQVSSSGTISLSTNFTIRGSLYKKIGKIAEIMLDITNDGNAFEKGRTTLGVLPDFLIPFGSLFMPISCASAVGSNLTVSSNVAIFTDGAIYLDNFQNDDIRQVYIHLTCITKN